MPPCEIDDNTNERVDSPSPSPRMSSDETPEDTHPDGSNEPPAGTAMDAPASEIIQMAPIKEDEGYASDASRRRRALEVI